MYFLVRRNSEPGGEEARHTRETKNLVQLNNEIYAKGREIPPTFERQKSEMKFPKFDPSEASFDVDPPNIIPPKAYKRRKGS